ncbi:MAG: class I SAM-dependent methyltransferase [Dehalococcoidales bacterium]|nr:class I SAM-dependent methyltransferase [Dehalococcoidales bacterium]
MDFKAIDWNALWQSEYGNSSWNKTPQKELWNKRADSYSQHISRVVEGQEDLDKDDYISKMLDRIEVKPEWTVLDIGSGPGTLSIPLAKKSHSITALDISSQMLKNLKKNADKCGLNNIRYFNSSWQDAFAEKLVGEHDVIVASRSLMHGNMKDALSSIAALSRQAAYLTFPVIHLPFDWEVYQAIGRNGKKHPSYIYLYNMLYQMGIIANVEILYSRIKVQFSGIQDAIDRLQWRTEPFTTDEKSRLVKFLEKKFDEQKGSTVFIHEGFSRWALIWWKTVENHS